MNFVNLTPHAINVLTSAGDNIEYPASGQVARVTSRHELSANGAPHAPELFIVEYGNVTDLPEPVPGTLLIVSALVMQALPNRLDLVCPASGHPDVKRNSAGQIASVPGFITHGYRWMTDSDLDDLFPELEHTDFRNAIPEFTGGQRRLELMQHFLKVNLPLESFHILDCRESSDELEWCIAIK